MYLFSKNVSVCNIIKRHCWWSMYWSWSTSHFHFSGLDFSRSSIVICIFYMGLVLLLCYLINKHLVFCFRSYYWTKKKSPNYSKMLYSANFLA
uniref:Ovule protein n=1 Tax=Heterorhabditis bacteriophora TaxID=37862 RepID=A0A1I7X0F8_HETBA